VNKTSSIRKASLWIFILSFVSVNVCLILSQIFVYIESGNPETSGLFYNNLKIFNVGDAIGEKGLPWIIPYFDGVASISRVVRVYPNYLIFKPAMWITGVLLIRYWILNKKLIEDLKINHNDINKCLYFGVSSAVFLIVHSIFLGVKFDLSIYKLFRRIILLFFIIFEVTAQFYLIKIYIQNKERIKNLININILLFKKILVYTLIVVAILIFPFLPFNNFKTLKHILEWNYFIGVITFYFLTFFMWKKTDK
tara:strand:+ start:2706 stop:3461 length:756 start_codon:yes stop_codon:yes gene_type:complete